MNRTDRTCTRVLARLKELYRDVDRAVEPLEAVHAERLCCRRGCAGCCIDGITVFEVEALGILEHCKSLSDPLQPHPPGACAFLDAHGSCRIYEFRPYVCRTQGLPLRWIDEDSYPEPVEMRDICPLNDTGTPVEELPPEECWSIGPFEARLAALQAEISGGSMRRVRLRELFSGALPETEPAKIAGGGEEDGK